MKKFVCKLLAVILLLGALTDVLTACKKKPDIYSVRMTYQVSTAWPERKTIQGYLADPDGKHALTQDDPYVLLDVDGCPSIQVSIQFFIINETTGYWISHTPLEEHIPDSIGIGDSFYEYSIEQDGEWEKYTPIHDIYDEELPNQAIDYRNCYQLRRRPGTHRLKFRYRAFPPAHMVKIPFTEDAIFTIDIHIKGDDRENVTLCAEESDDYTKLTNVDGRDLFIMKQGISGEKRFLPHIGAYNQDNETVLAPMFPAYKTDLISEPHINAYFAKLNEYYPYAERFRYYDDRNLPYIPRTSGLYLVSFTYTGDERYQPAEYLCYIVIP